MSLKENYSLNEETFKFLLEFEKTVESGKVCTNQEVIDLFEASPYNRSQFDSYKSGKSSAMAYAFHRSENWAKLSKGTYKRK